MNSLVWGLWFWWNSQK